ncbi:glutamate receptor ionotropic, kainate glr-3-like [Tachypleus tridentatus]|uniref:glutamate receptor ionotropic, kainate glr-3-like n=1 Tax=Tachypleus tridentatus TaxID=6853 RepID=UPI003FD4B8AD
MHLRIAVEEWEPWIQVDETADGNMTINGPMAQVLQYLSRSINFTYELKRPFDHEWGILTNGSWTGMIGMINRNEADVGLGPFALSYDRFLAVKATRPMYINYNTILVNYQNQKTDFYRYVYALQWEVWFGLVASLIIVSFVSLVSAYFMNDRDRSKLSFLNFLDHFTRMYGNIFSQASSVDINYNHQRVLRAFWWMAIIVLMQSFSGHLLATLVLDSNSQINDLRSLDRSGVLPELRKVQLHTQNLK